MTPFCDVAMVRPAESLVGALVLVACASAPDPGPDETLRTARERLAKDDPAAGHALLSADLRRRWPRDRFDTRWRETAPERSERAAALAATGPLSVSARTGPGPGQVELRLEEGGWRIASGAVPGMRLHTPEDAVLALAEAADRRDLPAVLALLSRPVRERVERNLTERLEKLRAALVRDGGGHEADPRAPRSPRADIDGDHATFTVDAGFRIELVREGGEWRVLDFN